MVLIRGAIQESQTVEPSWIILIFNGNDLDRASYESTGKARKVGVSSFAECQLGFSVIQKLHSGIVRELLMGSWVGDIGVSHLYRSGLCLRSSGTAIKIVTRSYFRCRVNATSRRGLPTILGRVYACGKHSSPVRGGYEL